MKCYKLIFLWFRFVIVFICSLHHGRNGPGKERFRVSSYNKIRACKLEPEALNFSRSELELEPKLWKKKEAESESEPLFNSSEASLQERLWKSRGGCEAVTGSGGAEFLRTAKFLEVRDAALKKERAWVGATVHFFGAEVRVEALKK